jgi:hypothetical protein
MTDGFVSYWSDTDDPFYEFSKKMIETSKVVRWRTFLYIILNLCLWKELKYEQ